MRYQTELLPNGHRWWRIARADWNNPLDPTFAQRSGGRWNPPQSFATLYLNEDQTTARANMQLFAAAWPYQPEDLRESGAPILVEALLPRDQRVADGHSQAGVAALGMPSTDPFDRNGSVIGHSVSQPIGARVLEAGLRGVRYRGARLPLGAGRELAWFPATVRSRARMGAALPFASWFWK